MPNKRITIKGIKPGSTDLDLSDGGTTEVSISSNERTVIWDIDKKSGVKLFRIEGNTRHHHPFDKPIPTDFNTEVQLHVDGSQTPFVWEYSIHYINDNNEEHTFDPKISILP